MTFTIGRGNDIVRPGHCLCTVVIVNDRSGLRFVKQSITSQIASLARKSKISSPTWARHGHTSPETRNFAGTELLPLDPILATVIVIVRIGPEKGVIHIATAAVGNAVWDMYARSRSKPLWKLIVDMTPVRSL
jgi:hypothetical protein